MNLQGDHVTSYLTWLCWSKAIVLVFFISGWPGIILRWSRKLDSCLHTLSYTGSFYNIGIWFLNLEYWLSSFLFLPKFYKHVVRTTIWNFIISWYNMSEQVYCFTINSIFSLKLLNIFSNVTTLLVWAISDLKEAYIADSESSSIRALDLKTGGSRLLAGGDPVFSDNLFRVYLHFDFF